MAVLKLTVDEKTVHIPAGNVNLTGILSIPEHAIGLVIFSHGSGSSRLSVRNRLVAEHLHEKNIATLLFDLLTPEEEYHYMLRFDIELLTERLLNATEWIIQQEETRWLPIGLFGASTGAASAIKVAVMLGRKVKAVVSRGGRPDMAEQDLEKLKSPTLLIVGSEDLQVLRLNKKAFEKINCEKELAIVQGATHLFEESGKLEEAANLAKSWFTKHF